MLNLSILLEQSAKRHPSQKAMTFMDTTLTYAQLNGAANQVANGLMTKGIKKGDKVKVFFSALGTEMEQKITFVGQTINTANRTFKVQIDLPNKDGKIKPNLVGTVKINDFQQEGAITVPTNLIQIGTDGNKFLYVVKEESGKKIAKKVVVKTGMSYEGSTIVTEGLSATDEVISKGYNEVVDGENVRFIKS